ncbi:MAG: hypothetical protein AAF416_04645 [Pseudomonadota bacterium]
MSFGDVAGAAQATTNVNTDNLGNNSEFGNGDSGGLAGLTARAEALYLHVMNLNMTFQEDTAPEKVAKDQSGKVQN